MKALKIIFLIFMLLPLKCFAFEGDNPLPQKQLEQRAQDLFDEIRCVVCTSQSVAESDADMAKDLRRFIRDEMLKGKTDREIKDYLVSRYGEEVLMKPPFKASTYLLWSLPFIILGYGIYLIFLRRPLA